MGQSSTKAINLMAYLKSINFLAATVGVFLSTLVILSTVTTTH